MRIEEGIEEEGGCMERKVLKKNVKENKVMNEG